MPLVFPSGHSILLRVDLNKYRKRLKQARNLAQRWRMSPEDLEDFLSFCTEAWVRGRSFNTNVSHLKIDFDRRFRGCKRKRTDNKKDLFLHREARIASENVFDFIPNQKKVPDLEHAEILNILHSRQRCIVLLAYKWGLSQEEISVCFGTTLMTINQQMHEAFKKIRQFTARQTTRSNETPPQSHPVPPPLQDLG